MQKILTINMQKKIKTVKNQNGKNAKTFKRSKAKQGQANSS